MLRASLLASWCLGDCCQFQAVLAWRPRALPLGAFGNGSDFDATFGSPTNIPFIPLRQPQRPRAALSRTHRGCRRFPFASPDVAAMTTSLRSFKIRDRRAVAFLCAQEQRDEVDVVGDSDAARRAKPNESGPPSIPFNSGCRANSHGPSGPTGPVRRAKGQRSMDRLPPLDLSLSPPLRVLTGLG